MALLTDLVRPPGRPRIEPERPVDDRPGAITREILRYVMDHPGCVHGGSERRHYHDSFRHRVLELRREHDDLDLRVFAEAVGVPQGTVEDWLRPGRGEQRSHAKPRPPQSATEPDVKLAKVETVLQAWREWHGDFTSFCDHLRHHHRLELGNSLISELLFEHGERTPARRGRRNSDEAALRGAFDTFFPGAQWVGDGKEVTVAVDGECFTYNFELDVDTASGAWVGTSVRDSEDAEAVVEAFEQGVETTGDAPIGLLLDNRPSNHTPEVDEALGDTMRTRATTSRPQNKAHVEGAFGLFAQKAPELILHTGDPRDLGRQLVVLVVVLFARILNHRPRRDRHGNSRVELYQQPVSEEQKQAARSALRERLRKQERARRTREARLDPDIKRLLDDAFERLELLDPERHFRGGGYGGQRGFLIDCGDHGVGRLRHGR